MKMNRWVLAFLAITVVEAKSLAKNACDGNLAQTYVCASTVVCIDHSFSVKGDLIGCVKVDARSIDLDEIATHEQVGYQDSGYARFDETKHRYTNIRRISGSGSKSGRGIVSDINEALGQLIVLRKKAPRGKTPLAPAALPAPQAPPAPPSPPSTTTRTVETTAPKKDHEKNPVPVYTTDDIPPAPQSVPPSTAPTTRSIGRVYTNQDLPGPKVEAPPTLTFVGDAPPQSQTQAACPFFETFQGFKRELCGSFFACQQQVEMRFFDGACNNLNSLACANLIQKAYQTKNYVKTTALDISLLTRARRHKSLVTPNKTKAISKFLETYQPDPTEKFDQCLIQKWQKVAESADAKKFCQSSVIETLKKELPVWGGQKSRDPRYEYCNEAYKILTQCLKTHRPASWLKIHPDLDVEGSTIFQEVLGSRADRRIGPEDPSKLKETHFQNERDARNKEFVSHLLSRNDLKTGLKIDPADLVAPESSDLYYKFFPTYLASLTYVTYREACTKKSRPQTSTIERPNQPAVPAK
ncbi:MAG: hypothetical protein IT289_09780 [Oligoflexia bacterium]|nr:hypothetical protein [Oligoflexia bacterium]